MKSWVCSNCGGICETNEILKGNNPFDPKEIIHGCPSCKEIDTFTLVCEIESCITVAEGGIDTFDGYKHFCNRHLNLRLESKE